MHFRFSIRFIIKGMFSDRYVGCYVIIRVANLYVSREKGHSRSAGAFRYRLLLLKLACERLVLLRRPLHHRPRRKSAWSKEKSLPPLSGNKLFVILEVQVLFNIAFHF